MHSRAPRCTLCRQEGKGRSVSLFPTETECVMIILSYVLPCAVSLYLKKIQQAHASKNGHFKIVQAENPSCNKNMPGYLAIKIVPYFCMDMQA